MRAVPAPAAPTAGAGRLWWGALFTLPPGAPGPHYVYHEFTHSSERVCDFLGRGDHPPGGAGGNRDATGFTHA